MIKSSIVYATKTKHSKRIADRIASELQIKVEDIAGQPKLEDIDLLFIVGGVYGGESMPELLEYVRDLKPSSVKSVVLITSCVSGKQKQQSVRNILEEKGIHVIDEFICRGALAFIFLGHPNSKDLNQAVDFARKNLQNYSYSEKSR